VELHAHLPIPVSDVLFYALKFIRQKQSIVGDEISGLFQIVHPLFDPML
jgi:hypothetical protein